MNVLPGFPFDGQGRDTFSRGKALVPYFQRYECEFDLPVRTGASVISVKRSEEHGPFVVATQISGLGRHGHTVSLQQLASQGAVIPGRLLDIDAHLARIGIEPPPLEEDPADVPDRSAECASPLRRLELRDAGVGAIIRATGFIADAIAA